MIKKIINKLIEINLFKNFFEKLRPNYLILYYHRVIKDEKIFSDLGPNIHLCVKESEFKKQMEFLKENYNVISLDKLYKQNFECNEFSVVITFDDGYKDNIEIAYPILEKNHLPATIYLISRNLLSSPWAWWIELWNYLYLSTSINFNGKKIKCENYSKKLQVFNNFKKLIKKLNFHQQLDFFKSLTLSDKRENHKDLYITNEELKSFKDNKYLNFGCHTHEHLSLSNFSEDEVEKQIKLSKKIIEEILGKPIKHFAYPYGGKEDLNFSEDKLLRKLNLKTAVTTLEVTKTKNEFYLPRVSIGPFVNIQDFKRKMIGFDIAIKKILKMFTNGN